MLDKTFDFTGFEAEFYQKSEPFFKAGQAHLKNSAAYTIMMPPPNVTGSLHLGHALTYTLQDILVRFKRMDGYDALWQPGTDHAGIATQMVVERNLAKDGIKRHDLGREKFIDEIWKWKAQSEGTIVSQQRRLAISPDWERSRFTMDEGLSKAVVKVFVQLHREGLIYRDKRLVNWDQKFQTAISDVEVINQDEDGKLWYVSYDIKNHEEKVIIATTRPETMLGDTGIAVHPDDARFQHLIGKTAIIPIINKEIPIIADEYCDQEKGSGAVKITPAHDFNDFEVGKRNNLDVINILNPDCTLNENTPSDYQGLSVEAARDKILAELEKLGRITQIEKIHHSVPYGERSGLQVQPLLTDQWFVDAKTLAAPALEAVKSGKTQFVPKTWENTYFEWLNNIQPWCISRQIWWGHQIPAWFGPDGEIFVAEDETEAHAMARKYYGTATELNRETDVLDTWFSSALWPFSTLGWPDQESELSEKHFPTDVLITGFDIIFFWVARMMMMGLHFKKQIPFKNVYIHALVRDEKGQKMSKSKGNVIDPLVMADKYGCDALRFTLAQLSTPGRDIRLGESKIKGNRNFITKIWNAARFMEMNHCFEARNFVCENPKLPVTRWLVEGVNTLIQNIRENLDEYRFDLYAHNLYHWLWDTFCDIYLESLKAILNSDNADEAQKTEARAASLWAFEVFLKLAHPIMPMVTEKLYADMGLLKDEKLLLITAFPKVGTLPKSEAGAQSSSMDLVLDIVQNIRSLRGIIGLSPALKLNAVVIASTPDSKTQLQQSHSILTGLARLESLSFSSNQSSENQLPIAVSGNKILLDIGAHVDLGETKALIQKKYDNLISDCVKLEKKVTNEAFKQAKPDLWAQDSVSLNMKQKDCCVLKEILAAF